MLFALLAAYRWWQYKGVSAVSRGEQVARQMGCFSCHGPMGMKGIPNPGSDVQEVPSWDGGNVMMYVENENDIREWILYGMPNRLKEEHAHHHHDEEDKGPLLTMPSYKGKLSEQELDDLIAFYKAVAWYEQPEDSEAAAGRRLAQKQGCFSCHGPEGRGNISNPGSLKGYIPSWDGPDFPELVKNNQELREWILDGSIGRFRKNPIGNQFLKRQQIKMPAYRGVLTKQEINQLIQYIHWLRKSSN